MYSTLQPQPHWRTGDIKDIERDLIDWLVHNTGAIDAESVARIHRNDYEFRWALKHPDRLFDYYTIRIHGVQTMQSRQWTPLRRSRGIRNGGAALVDVRWSYSKICDTPVRGKGSGRFEGYRGGPLLNPLVREEARS